MSSKDPTESDIEEAEVFEEDVEFSNMMHTLLVTEDGESLAEVMNGIKEGIEKQNKILLKIGGMMEKYFSTGA